MEILWSNRHRATLAYLVGLWGMLSLLTGCDSLPSLRVPQRDLALSLQVESTGQQGVFAIAGQTNLPDKTEMVVLAIRQLRPTQPVEASTAPPPTYAILAYEPVQVAAGQWQTKLNLWRVAADGAYRETWQMEAARLQLEVAPDPEVQFLVTLAPQEVLALLDGPVPQRSLRLPQPFLRSTVQGDRFLQVAQPRIVGLPSGNTTPPVLRPEDLNDGWGERYRLVPEPPLPYTLTPEDERKTDAPARLEESLL